MFLTSYNVHTTFTPSGVSFCLDLRRRFSCCRDSAKRPLLLQRSKENAVSTFVNPEQLSATRLINGHVETCSRGLDLDSERIGRRIGREHGVTPNVARV